MKLKRFGEYNHNQGKVYKFVVGNVNVEILFLYHALRRAKKWQLSEDQIAEALLFPDEVLKGHLGRYIAHKLHGDHILRAVYEYYDDYPTVVTVLRCIFHMPAGITRGDQNMKITYSNDADVCVIELRSGQLHDSIDLKEGVILHLDEKGSPLEIEILNASKLVSFEEMAFQIPPQLMKLQSNSVDLPKE